MALNWLWSEKCGEATMLQNIDGKETEFTLSLYKGNAYLIFIYEYKDENGADMYNVWNFFLDRDHAKNCLGLNKKQGYTDNILQRNWSRMTRIQLNKSMYPQAKELAGLLVQAFDNINIEIYSEEATHENPLL